MVNPGEDEVSEFNNSFLFIRKTELKNNCQGKDNANENNEGYVDPSYQLQTPSLVKELEEGSSQNI